MARLSLPFLLVPVLLVLGLLAGSGGPSAAVAAAPPDRLSLAGVVRDVQGRALGGVRLEVEINGQPVVADEPILTGKRGAFAAELAASTGTLPAARVAIKASKPGFHSHSASPLKLQESPRDQTDARASQGLENFTLKRRLTPAAWLAGGVLAAVYALIALEWLHRALAATLGAAVLLFVTYAVGTFYPDFIILSFSEAMAAIDMNVIFLLLAMMLIVGVLRKTGLFQWLALQAYAPRVLPYQIRAIIHPPPPGLA